MPRPPRKHHDFTVVDAKTAAELDAEYDEAIKRLKQIRTINGDIIDQLTDMKRVDGVGGRSLAVAITNLETADLWLGRALFEAIEGEV